LQAVLRRIADRTNLPSWSSLALLWRGMRGGASLGPLVCACTPLAVRRVRVLALPPVLV